MRKLNLFFILMFACTVSSAQNEKNTDSQFINHLCADLRGSISQNPAISLNKLIMIKLGLNDNDINKEVIISNFYNQHKDCLICNTDIRTSIHKNESLFKFSISLGGLHFLEYYYDNEKYNIDFNGYQIINGEKETLVDYIDKALKDENILSRVNKERLLSLQDSIIEMGGKRGSELND